MELSKGLSGVKYSSDQPAMDSFEPSKLGLPSSRGFTAERFIKPPVTLYIHFPCSVSLEKILISNNRGSHVSSGLEVYSYACASNRQPDSHPAYMIIGKCHNAEPGTVTFTNRRLSKCFDDSDHALSSHDRSLLNLCRIIAIRITRTLNSCLPVIAALSIFGRPHDLSYCTNTSPASNSNFILPREAHDSRCERQLTETVCGKHVNVATTGLADCNFNSPKNPSSPTKEGPQTAASNSYGSHRTNTNLKYKNMNDHNNMIPDEFFDPITLEVMSQPVLLPSGKTVDQSTLDRHNEQLALWGHKPCDPFTGKPLDRETAWQKPQLNLVLKERIDKYMLTHHVPTGRSLRRKASQETRNQPPAKRSMLYPSACAVTTQASPEGSSISERIDRLVAQTNGRILTLDRASERDGSRVCSACSNPLSESARGYKLECDHVVCKTCLKPENFSNGLFICSLCESKTCKSKIFAVFS